MWGGVGGEGWGRSDNYVYPQPELVDVGLGCDNIGFFLFWSFFDGPR